MYDFSLGSAAALAARLDGHRVGYEWRCACPICGGHSLCITEGRTGKLLFKCWSGGCQFTDIITALREDGLMDGLPTGSVRVADEDEIAKIARRIRTAQSLYRGSVDAMGTLLEVYLRSRGIAIVPSVLRFIRWCPHRNKQCYPAMAAPILDIEGALVGLSATFLRPDGCGKVDLPAKEQRQFYGLAASVGGAVRLGTSGGSLVVGEGIETVISAMLLHGYQNGWAALSANGLKALKLPDEIDRVTIAVDNDVDGVGADAALFAAHRWTEENRMVDTLLPPDGDKDFNDTLRRLGQ
jgi:hypothetical protein